MKTSTKVALIGGAIGFVAGALIFKKKAKPVVKSTPIKEVIEEVEPIIEKVADISEKPKREVKKGPVLKNGKKLFLKLRVLVVALIIILRLRTVIMDELSKNRRAIEDLVGYLKEREENNESKNINEPSEVTV